MAEAPKIIVNADLFRIAYAAVSTEETRYYLNGVYVHPHDDGGAVMVSTDGHRLLSVYDADGKCDRPAIIRLSKDALKHCKSKSRDTRRLIVELGSEPAGSVAKVMSTEWPGTAHEETSAVAITERCEIDGTFPDYHRVIPKPAEGSALAAFNPRYLAAMGSIGDELAKLAGADAGMVVRCANERDPAIITWGSRHPAFGVLMPMRGDLSSLPEWAPKPATSEKIAA